MDKFSQEYEDIQKVTKNGGDVVNIGGQEKVILKIVLQKLLQME